MQSHAANGRPSRNVGDLLAAFGWICFGICGALFLLWYVSGLSASGVSGRIGIVINPEAPQDQWRIEPAADIEVFIRWDGELASSLIQFENYCARTRVVRTDQEGRFSVDGWWETPGWPPPRVDYASASPMVPGLAPQYFPYPSVPPVDYTVILGPPPADSALALMFTEQMSAARLAEQSGCPPPRKH